MKLFLYEEWTESLYHEQRSYKGRSDFWWPSIVKQHTSQPGKFRYNTFCVFSIIMNFVSFALGAARSLVLLVSLLEVLSFKRSSAQSTKHRKTALGSVYSRFNNNLDDMSPVELLRTCVW